MIRFKSYIVHITFGLCFFIATTGFFTAVQASVYYVSSISGDDAFDGLTANTPWRSIEKLQSVKLNPGDSVRFSRGASFDKPFYVNDSGVENMPVVLTDYGSNELSAPAFTNKTFEQGNFGNCIRIRGSFVVVENLYFHETPTYVGGNYTTDGGWSIWEMGTVYVDKGATHCIIRNNEFEDCPVGIKSYGEFTLITGNYLHDCNRVLAEWNWGPLGIWFGADHQEACYNRIFNYRAEDPRIHWAGDTGGGADGGAFEIDDARYPKSDIRIHHNYTRDCQGFLEVTWTDVLQNPDYEDFHIHHNISDDYQTFTAVWRGKNFRIENNTIVRRKVNANDWGVFNITGTDTRNKIRNNIIITEQNIPVFNTGIKNTSKPNNIIENNLYFAASGTINLGKEGPGSALVHGDPLLANYGRLQYPEDFAIRNGSPAIDKGQDLGYTRDFFDNPVPAGTAPDIGAVEYDEPAAVPVVDDRISMVKSTAGAIIITNLDHARYACIYDLTGILVQKVQLVSGENHIPVREKRMCIVGLENGYRQVIY